MIKTQNVNEFKNQIIEDPEQLLFNIVSSSLLNEFRYYDDSDERKKVMLSAMDRVIEGPNPEFLLQLAYYLRNELFIRTTTNYILAYASLNEKTQKFLKKYLPHTILLPTDLQEVCQFVQLMSHDREENGKETGKMEIEDQPMNYYSQEYITKLRTKVQEFFDVRKQFKFPKSLQKAIKETFPKFKIYQLGKYCSDSNRKKNLKRYLQAKNPEKHQQKIKMEKEVKDIQFKIRQKFREYQEFQKQLLRGMGYLGIEYQQDKKQELKSKAGGKSKLLRKTIDKAKQTKVYNLTNFKFMSMKDIIRFCHVSSPKFHVMSIMGKKYPSNEQEFNNLFQGELETYKLKFEEKMAGQRMKIDIPVTWETQLSSKGNTKEVWENLILNNQLPYMAMLRNLRNILKAEIGQDAQKKLLKTIENPNLIKNAKIFPLQFFTALEIVENLYSLEKTIPQSNEWNVYKYRLEQVQEEEKKEEEASEESKIFAKMLIESILKALHTSVDNNLDEIKGHTIVMTDVSGSMRCALSGNQSYGSVRCCYELGLLLALLIKQKCQKCSYYLFSSPGSHPDPYLEIPDLDNNNILENMKKITSQIPRLGGGNDSMAKLFKVIQTQKQKVDNVVFLSDLMISDGFSDYSDYRDGSTLDYMKEYIKNVNPNLKIFSVDLKGYGYNLNQKLKDYFSDQNFVRINGMSPSILKFITINEQDQIKYIKNYASQLCKKESEEEAD